MLSTKHFESFYKHTKVIGYKKFGYDTPGQFSSNTYGQIGRAEALQVTEST